MNVHSVLFTNIHELFMNVYEQFMFMNSSWSYHQGFVTSIYIAPKLNWFMSTCSLLLKTIIEDVYILS